MGERLGPVIVEVELQPPHGGDVALLALPPAGVDRVHGHEEIPAVGVEMAEPTLIAGTRQGVGRDDALLDATVLKALDSEEREVLIGAVESPYIRSHRITRVGHRQPAMVVEPVAPYMIKWIIVVCLPPRTPPIRPRSFGRRPASFPRSSGRRAPEACFAADEFFSARVRNVHTRRAYGRPVRKFLEWCEEHGLSLQQISPGTAARFIDGYGASVSGQKVALAALRQFFDVLVTRHAVVLNPFLSVRGPRQDTRRGKTPEITVEQTRELLAAMDCSRPMGLRDRAVIGTLAYTGARVGAIAQLRLQDLRDYGEHRSLWFREKRGKEREIPVRIDLDRWLAEYVAAAGMMIPRLPRSSARRTSTPRPVSGRAASAPGPSAASSSAASRTPGLPQVFTPHSFRVMVVTDLLTQGVPIEDVQYLAGHSHPSTTQVYDRRDRRVSRNIVERISV